MKNISNPTERLELTIDTKRLIVFLASTAVICLITQLFLKASVVVLLFAIIIISIGLISFIIMGSDNSGGWLAFFYVAGNILIALYAKTLMAQTLDSNLYTPINSFFILALCSLELLLALFIVNAISVGNPVFKPLHNVRVLKLFSYYSFILGMIFWAINQYYAEKIGSGFGGVSIFRMLMIMGIITRSAFLLERSKNRQLLDFTLAIMLIIAVFLGLLTNTKTQAALPVVSYFSTLFFYRRSIPIKYITVLLLSAIIFLFVVVPSIHAWRYMGIKKMTTEERISFMKKAVKQVLKNDDAMEKYSRLASIPFKKGYYYYFGKDGTSQQILGRYASIQQIDPVIAKIDIQGKLGGSVIWPAFARIMPRVLYKDKPEYIEGFYILVNLGLYSPFGGAYPTVPLAAQAYAGYGLFGVFFLPFFTFFIFLLLLKKIGWNLYKNVYGIFFFCAFIPVYSAQASFGQFMEATFRNFPLLIITFMILKFVINFRFQRLLMVYKKLEVISDTILKTRNKV